MKLRKSENREKVFNRPICVLTTAKHQYLESFEGLYESPPPFIIVTGCSGEKLNDVLDAKKSYKRRIQKSGKKKKDTDSESGEKVPFIIEKGQKTIIACKIAPAMAYLHSLNIIHRDLCTSNITIDKDFNPRVIKI